MRFEVKTQKDDFSKSSFSLYLAFVFLSFIIILGNLSVKLGTIAKHYEINYICKMLIIEKSSSNFKKLSKLTNETSKQKMWDLCREIVN